MPNSAAATRPRTRDIRALRDRATVLRRHIVEMLHEAGSGHPGGSLSAVEIVTALYFGGYLRHDPKRPDWPDRDRFILSKGHGVPVQYAAMAEAGYLPVSELKTLRKIDSRLQGHPVYWSVPGIEASTGSLGQGLSIGLGIALAAKLDGRSYNVFVVLGDGECQEGQVWEAAMAAGHHQPKNLFAIVDYNKFQLDGAVADILDVAPLAGKFAANGWHTREIDGHDLCQVTDALDWALHIGGPACIVANTVKGKGVSFMEGQNKYHGVAPTEEELTEALKELSVLHQAEQCIEDDSAHEKERGR
ncbi:MAG: transketolase [Longimicrobiales bacterium]